MVFLYLHTEWLQQRDRGQAHWKRSQTVVTYQPAPSCPPCLSLGVGHGHLLAEFPSGDICSGRGSELQTSGSVAAVTHSPTQQRSPCYWGHEFTKLTSAPKRGKIRHWHFLRCQSRWTDRLSLQASQPHTVSAGIGAARSGVGSMGSVGTAVVSLSSAAVSWPMLPFPTGMCKRKSWLCGKYEKLFLDPLQDATAQTLTTVLNGKQCSSWFDALTSNRAVEIEECTFRRVHGEGQEVRNRVKAKKYQLFVCRSICHYNDASLNEPSSEEKNLFITPGRWVSEQRPHLSLILGHMQGRYLLLLVRLF